MNLADRAVKFSSVSALIMILNACATPVIEEPIIEDPAPTRIEPADLSVRGLMTTDATLDSLFTQRLDAGVTAILPDEIEAYLDEQEAHLKSEFGASGMTVNDLGDYISVQVPVRSLFSMQGSDLAPQAYGELEALAQLLRSYESSIVEISSHSSTSDSKDYDLSVSERRANAIGNLLRALDVDPERMIIVAGGSNHPIAKGNSARDRDLNLRVELNLIPVRDKIAEAEAAAAAVAEAMAALEEG